MHREAAGLATVVPMMNFEEVLHHTGAPLIAFPRQIMASARLKRRVQCSEVETMLGDVRGSLGAMEAGWSTEELYFVLIT